jgi:hypothetical protein
MGPNEQENLLPYPKPPQTARTKTLFAFITFLLIGAITAIIFLAVRDHQDRQDAKNPANRFRDLADFCTDIPPIAATEYTQRRQKLITALQNAPSSNTFVTEPVGASLTYYTGVSWKVSERPFFFWAHSTGDFGFLVPSFEKTKLQNQIKDINHLSNATLIAWEEDESPFIVFHQFFNQTGPVSLWIDAEVRRFISNGLAEVVGGYEFVETAPATLRMIK